MKAVLKEFEEQVTLLEEFRGKVESLLNELLTSKQLKFHQISSRVKSKQSLQGKLSRKPECSSLTEITDVVGCRVITYFEDEVDLIAALIKKEFDVDDGNSIDKRLIEFDRFGYLSLHFIVTLPKFRLRLTEYKKFKDLQFEIQIRSVLQHGWAEIEHDIGYKGKHSIPDVVKRRFSRIAALLETADLEFVRLRDDLAQYEKIVGKEIKNDPAKVPLDQASLRSFITNNKNVNKADAAIAEMLDITLTLESQKYVEELLELLVFAGVNTIGDLESVYEKYLACIIAFSDSWRIRPKSSQKLEGVKGISVYDTGYFLSAMRRTEDELAKFLAKGSVTYQGKEAATEAKRVRESFESLDQNCQH